MVEGINRRTCPHAHKHDPWTQTLGEGDEGMGQGQGRLGEGLWGGEGEKEIDVLLYVNFKQ